MVQRVGLALVFFTVIGLTVAVAGSHAKLYTLEGTLSDGRWGQVGAGVGDVDADGYDDFALGSTKYNDRGVYGGVVEVRSGRTGEVLYEYVGEDWDEHIARDLAAAGDVNGDGYDDILMGGWIEGSSYTGRAWVLSGKDGSTLYSYTSPEPSSAFADSMNGAGDLNGDGYDDFIIGAPGYGELGAGLAIVYSGKDGTKLFTKYGAEDWDRFGREVGGAGDANGDGYPDFFISASGEKNADGDRVGVLHVYSGKDAKEILTVLGENVDDSFGYSVGTLADVNGDGCDDFVVGAPNYGQTYEREGRVYLISGKDGKTLQTITGAATNEDLGHCVDGAGDVDNDGTDDFIFGADGNDANGYDAGAAWVYSGKTGKVLYHWKGSAADAELGWKLCGLGDVNGDGRDDVYVAEVAWRKGEQRGVGRAFVYASQAPECTLTVENGAVATQKSTVTLGLTWDGKDATVTGIRLRNPGDAWGDWFTPVASKAFSLTPGDGPRTVEMEVKTDDNCYSPTISASIVVDTVAPAATLLIDDGADYCSTDVVSLQVTATDDGSGAIEMRLRNEGEDYGEWIPLATPHSFSLTPADGLRQVDAEVRDRAGNVSAAASDTILLDATPPNALLLINGGNKYTNQTVVDLTLDVSDAGSGLDDIRLRNAGGEWIPWRSYKPALVWMFPKEDGPKVLELQARDLLGNLSAPVSATVLLDTIPPSLRSASLNNNEPYVLPDEPLKLGIHATDTYEASGVSEFRVRFSPGGGWSDWYPTIEGYSLTTIEQPTADGNLVAGIVVRDAAGNPSGEQLIPFQRVEVDRITAAGGAKLKGAIAPANDVDAMSVLLARGDALKVKLATKVKDLDLALDLVRPDGTELVLGRYPVDAKKPMISGFVAPETGEYLVVVRRESPGQTTTGDYSLAVTVKQAKTNKKVKGTANADGISFEATAGTLLKAKLSGEGLTAAGMTLTGPDGDVPFTVKEKKGKVTILPVALTAGSGTYRLRFGAARTVKHALTLKLPKKVKAFIND